MPKPTRLISLTEIFEIFRYTIDALRADSLPGQFEAFESTFPRDPMFVVRGLEAVFGLTITVTFVDFYKGLDISGERRDFLSFYEYADPNNRITVFVNTNKYDNDEPLISDESLRFLILKEVFNAVIRAAMHKGIIETKGYPDTVDFAAFISAHLDWISERFSVYDFDEAEYSPTVSVENAAELLAIMFLVNIPELYQARKALGVKPKAFWKIENNGNEIPTDEVADLRFALFEYEKYAQEYCVKVRFIVVLIKTDFILKIVQGIKSIVSDIKEVFSNFPDQDDDDGIEA